MSMPLASKATLKKTLLSPSPFIVFICTRLSLLLVCKYLLCAIKNYKYHDKYAAKHKVLIILIIC